MGLFGILFDIDGVLMRGKKVLPFAKDALYRLIDKNKNWKVPCVFVTNSGNSLRRQKAEQLSTLFDINVHEDQVVLSHSPLRMLSSKFKSKNVLVTGQSKHLHEIAANLGFNKCVTVEEIAAKLPHLDMIDVYKRLDTKQDGNNLQSQSFHHGQSNHFRHKKSPLLHRVEAILLLGEPIAWETTLQILIDALLTDGYFDGSEYRIPYPHLPVLACNKDLVWMSDASNPRFAHGSFLVCLEALYKRYTKRDLRYTTVVGKPSEITYYYADYIINKFAQRIGWPVPIRRLYAIGDNPESDICGANLYNRHLQTRHQKTQRMQHVLTSGGSVETVPSGSSHIPMAASVHENGHDHDHVALNDFAASCTSVLVETGVFSHQSSFLFQEGGSVFDQELIKPVFTTRNVADALDLIFKNEGYNPELNLSSVKS